MERGREKGRRELRRDGRRRSRIDNYILSLPNQPFKHSSQTFAKKQNIYRQADRQTDRLTDR